MKRSMGRWLCWVAAAVLIMGFTLVAYLPAAVLATWVEAQSEGRLALADPQGTLWDGSAVLAAPVASAALSQPTNLLAPVFPGRFEWQLSPWLLLGRVNLRIQNAEALPTAVSLEGSWSECTLSEGSMDLAAERLSTLGAPFNTLRATGQMRLAWSALRLQSSGRGLEIYGPMQLELKEIASALSPVKPLGAYRMQFVWGGKTARLTLSTRTGPLMLEGEGDIVDGRLQFSGQAWAQPEEELRLAQLLNLLGQRRQIGNRNVIALEFK